MADDYLFDGKGEPDPEVAELERALAPLRYQPRSLEAPAQNAPARNSFELKRSEGAPVAPLRRRPLTRWLLLAAAAALVVSGGALLRSRAPQVTIAAPSFAVERLEGAPRVGASPFEKLAALAVGEWLSTDARSRARIAVADIGAVEVGTNSRVRLTTTGPSEHRLDLERGSISARVDAPPRLFVVGTEAATAVDLGCAYQLEVDDRGHGRLQVTSGWVALEGAGRSSMVGAGFDCETRPGKGPGTPSRVDASSSLREALSRFDFEGGRETALRGDLKMAGPRDALTVWHLIPRVSAAFRGEVVTRLAELSPRPASLTEEQIMALDAAALDRWRVSIVSAANITW